jgi:putative PIN family toxin of toxin-antitoxin system
VVSPEIVAECLEVISRPKLMNKYLVAENRDVDAMLVRIAASTVVIPSHVPAVCRDPSDDKFLAAALASGSRFIVSADNDLLSLVEYEGIRICTPATMLSVLDSQAI